MCRKELPQLVQDTDLQSWPLTGIWEFVFQEGSNHSLLRMVHWPKLFTPQQILGLCCTFCSLSESEIFTWARQVVSTWSTPVSLLGRECFHVLYKCLGNEACHVWLPWLRTLESLCLVSSSHHCTCFSFFLILLCIFLL